MGSIGCRGQWDTCSLGDLFRIKHGFAFKGEFFADKGDHVLLTPGNFKAEGGIRPKGDKEKYYVGPVPPEFLLKSGDLLLVMTDLTQEAPILGSAAFIPQDNLFLHNQRLGKIVQRANDKVESGYLYFLLNTQFVRAQIRASASGATVRHTSPDRIYEVRVSIPPLRIQRKIAAILSAYDDLIENNSRRIAILEEMAQALYREWFVHFRFPGHQSVPLVDSPFGPIPQGWQVVKLGEVAIYINRGISPKYDENAESMVLNQRCIRDGRLSLGPARHHMTHVSDDKRVRFGDVLINSTGIGTLGRVAQVYQDLPDFTVDSHVTIVRPLGTVDMDYFGMCLQQLEPYFDGMGAGTTGQTELSRTSIASAQLLLPTLQIQRSFGTTVGPVRHLAIKLAKHNDNLRKSRDLLLPKLVSGELDVSELDIATDVERVTE